MLPATTHTTTCTLQVASSRQCTCKSQAPHAAAPAPIRRRRCGVQFLRQSSAKQFVIFFAAGAGLADCAGCSDDQCFELWWGFMLDTVALWQIAPDSWTVGQMDEWMNGQTFTALAMELLAAALVLVLWPPLPFVRINRRLMETSWWRAPAPTKRLPAALWFIKC